MNRYKVYYNTHKYVDCSDTPRSAHRFVEAETPDEAREIVRDMGMAGRRHIGMIHEAELIGAPIATVTVFDG